MVLFENHYELLNLFEKFQGLKTRDEQAESMELADHAGIVMTTLDKGIKSLDNIDEFFQYVHTVGASHTQIPGFKKDNFGKIKEPFLYAVRETLQERYTTNIEVIYKITIDFIIDTLVEGYEKALQCQENAVSSTED
ncbi:unnamed protein product [Darwinula stevensoni]|uniref:Globin domain-containing protein n=1 Tax=Darwinula stevensoni TaxID=69355 RepID=A0A7R8XIT0_9CRUS|nr:unnamed protein product [Darwinula stevensoni]CAG0891536.1 unnamed protein product [Darwinula stevensoni]